MATKNPLTSDYIVLPGHYIREALDALGMTQAELAQRMGRPPQALSEIINGKKAITEETAFELESVLGTPAHVWVNLERDFRFNLQQKAQHDNLVAQTGLVSSSLYLELTKMGLVQRTRDEIIRVRELLRFFQVANLQAVKNQYACAFRKSNKHDPDPYALAAWIRLAECQARVQEIPDFDKAKLETALSELRGVTLTEVSPEEAIRCVLNKCGVAFVMVGHLTKTYANGATFWLGHRPVVALSIRGAYEDVIWFSLFHEVGHLLLHSKGATFIEGLGLTNKEEDEADHFAQDALLPQPLIRPFIEAGDFSVSAVKSLSQKAGVSPAVVVGRIKHDLNLHDGLLHLNHIRRKIVWSKAKKNTDSEE